jgi:tRNA nucleotidyltransferase (CCA-adding enzyme)
MKIYLVGGAVRDKLLNYPVKEKDWVVVGATTQHMLDLGYKQVGKDFPVFLHPDSKEEYALARTERKTAPGYKGFSVQTSPDVTLHEDLQRRDLTINAMAEDTDGNIVDPFNGRQDLTNKILRHVSSAFNEDPVRILRVARFAARYHHLGFRVADETLQRMRDMVAAGEIDALVPERVWQEMHKALGEKHPEIFIQVLRDCGALQKILPEVDCLFGVPQPEKYHPEIDTGVHTLMVLQQACLVSEDTRVRFAALCHDLGKGITPKALLPAHHGHEEAGVPLVENVCTRLRVPNDHRDVAVVTARFHLYFHRAFELRPDTLLKFLEQMDVLRKPQRFEQFLLACVADTRGRPGYENNACVQTRYFRDAISAINSVDIEDLKQQQLGGKAMADAISRRRLSAIEALDKNHYQITQ